MSDRPHPETVEPPVAETASAGQIRRLDHVAIVIRNTDVALGHFRDKLGLTVVHSEELEQPRVRLTYLDAGNALIQLVEPLDDSSDAAHSLNEQGEGIHHICFAVDDALLGARELSPDGAAVVRGDRPWKSLGIRPWRFRAWGAYRMHGVQTGRGRR